MTPFLQVTQSRDKTRHRSLVSRFDDEGVIISSRNNDSGRFIATGFMAFGIVIRKDSPLT